jgi:hypothetical protein
MRYFIVILLCIAFKADGQIIRANPFYTSRAVAVVTDTLLLDSFPAAAAYSLRKLKSSYTGNCIRVRKTLNNTEQDIGFVNNFLDTASLKTFVGTSNGFVVTWYDQSGNGRDASNSTTTAQPKIYDSATASLSKRNNKVSLAPDGGDELKVTTGLDILQNKGYGYCFSVNCSVISSGISYLLLISNNVAGTARFLVDFNRTTNQRNGIGGRRLDANSFTSIQSSSNFSVTNLQLVSSIIDYATSDAYIYRNGTSVASNTSFLTDGNTSNTASASMSLFGSSGTNLNGSCSEIIIYNTNESSNRTKIENNINRNWLIY